MGSHNAGQCRLHSYCHVYIFKAQAIMGRAKFVVNSFKECRADVRNFSILHSCRAKAVAKTSKNAERKNVGSHNAGQCRLHSYCHVYIFKAQAIMGRAKFVVNSFKECRADVRNFSILHSCRAKAVAKTSKNAAPPLRKFLDFAYVRPCEPHTQPTLECTTNQTRYLTPKPHSFNLLLSCHL